MKIPNPDQRGILVAVAESQAGISVHDAVAVLQQRTGLSLLVARVRVSLALRALWQLGLVELHGRSETMSEKRERAHAVAARAAAAPEAFYRAVTTYRARVRGAELADPWGSAEACVRAKAREAERVPRLYVIRVGLTPQGRAAAAAGGCSDTVRNFSARGNALSRKARDGGSEGAVQVGAN